MKRFHVHLTAAQFESLRSIAERTGLTVAELVRRAVDVLIKRELAPKEAKRGR